jgi:hypothetical protein
MCKKFDEACGFRPSTTNKKPSIAQLKLRFEETIAKKILIFDKTPNGKTTRRLNELTWNYIAGLLRSKCHPKSPGLKSKRKNLKAEANATTGFELKRKYENKSTATSLVSKKKKVNRRQSRSQFPYGSGESPSLTVSRRYASKVRSVGECFICKGPNPYDETAGLLKPTSSDLNDLLPKKYINSTITTAYLNLLVRAFYEHGVRRSEADFLPDLRELIRTEGVHGALESYTLAMATIGSGSSSIDWQNDCLILLQLFSGPFEGGHWSLLVLDRTRGEGRHIAVFFDSLPSFHPGFEAAVRDDLVKAGVVHNASQWITARVPKQASASNDCGAYMCCIASSYIMAFQKAVLMDSPPIQAVEFHPRVNVKDWGMHARSHVAEAIQMQEVDEKTFFEKEQNSFFSLADLVFSYGN